MSFQMAASSLATSIYNDSLQTNTQLIPVLVSGILRVLIFDLIITNSFRYFINSLLQMREYAVYLLERRMDGSSRGTN